MRSDLIIARVEAFALAVDHHYRVAGVDHHPDSLPGTPYYFEPAWPQVYSTQLMTCLIKLTTADGTIGWGEAQAPIAPEVVVSVIEELVGPALLGREVGDVPEEYERLMGMMAVRGHQDGFFADAVAGVDIALWDAAGQASGTSLAAMLGGDPAMPIPLYVSGLRQPTEREQVRAAREFVAAGYGGIKLFLTGPPASAADRVRAIRTAVGPDVRLMVDLLWGFSLPDALAFTAEVEELDVAFCEAPLPVEALADQATLAEATRIPIAGGEHLHGLPAARRCAEHGVRILQPDVARTGLSTALRIAEMARELGRAVTWHVGTCSPVAMAASWGLATLDGPDPLQEHQVDLLPAMSSFVREPLRVEGGSGRLSGRPGLGVEVCETEVRAAARRLCDVRGSAGPASGSRRRTNG